MFKSSYDYYAVFDGHGGSACADYLKDNLHLLLSFCKNINTKPE